MKGQIYMQVSQVKKIEKQDKKKSTIRVWDETKKGSKQKYYIDDIVS